MQYKRRPTRKIQQIPAVFVDFPVAVKSNDISKFASSPLLRIRVVEIRNAVIGNILRQRRVPLATGKEAIDVQANRLDDTRHQRFQWEEELIDVLRDQAIDLI